MKGDRLFRIVLWIVAGLFSAMMVFMLASLLKESLPSIKAFGMHFLYGKEWNPVVDKFGLLPFLVGTLITSVLALIISVPFAMSIALFLGMFSKGGFWPKILGYGTDLLAGIPSVIYGFWALFFLVPIVRNFEMKAGIVPYGVGIFTASVVLAIMIIPYISSISKEVIKLVPRDLIEAGLALGATDLEVAKDVVLPYCRSGIVAGILLGFGRALGETMAVTMVIGNASSMPRGLFDPANTMASVIANEFTEATTTLHLSSLIQIGLWLFILNAIVNVIGMLIIKKMEVK